MAKLITSLELEQDSIWYRKSNLLTLFVELMATTAIPKDFKKKLLQFEQQILDNKAKENDFGTYYAAMFTGTNKRKERVVRGELFRKYVLGDTQ